MSTDSSATFGSLRDVVDANVGSSCAASRSASARKARLRQGQVAREFTRDMPNIWFTADFLFGHSHMIRYCNRPFRNVEEMDHTIRNRLNASVKANDILYFLGDFCIGSKARALRHREQICCKKIFAVPGNHDKQARKLTEEFSWLSNLAEISVHGQPIVLCHYAMGAWNGSHHGAWHLYGHSHGNLPDAPTSLSIDVGVDTHDIRPWHFDEIRLLMAKKAQVRSELHPESPPNSGRLSVIHEELFGSATPEWRALGGGSAMA